MKKRILAGAAVLCLAGSSIPAQAGELVTDLTGDAVLTCTDAIAMQKYLLGLGSLTKAQLAAADLNMDGRVNAFDYAMMKRSLLAETPPSVTVGSKPSPVRMPSGRLPMRANMP